jgi:hypothetical protein
MPESQDCSTERRNNPSDFCLSIKDMNVIEKHESFHYYQPKRSQILQLNWQNKNRNASKIQKFASWVLDNQNDLEFDSNDEIQSYLIPIPGEGHQDFKINLPPSKIEDSLRKYWNSSKLEGYKVNKKTRGVRNGSKFSCGLVENVPGSIPAF